MWSLQQLTSLLAGNDQKLKVGSLTIIVASTVISTCLMLILIVVPCSRVSFLFLFIIVVSIIVLVLVFCAVSDSGLHARARCRPSFRICLSATRAVNPAWSLLVLEALAAIDTRSNIL